MKKIGIVFLLIMIGISSAKAQVNLEEAKSKFIYNFTHFFAWPQSERSGEFVIGVLGSNDAYRELSSFVNGKKVNLQPIKVVKFDKVEDVSKCHVIYVTKMKSSHIDGIHNKTGHYTLIISETMKGVDSGSAINFHLIGNRLKYQFSGENARKLGLKYSSKIEEMSSNN